MDVTALFPTFIITLREGFEAALVVCIVMACLQKAQQTQLYRWIYLGIFGGVIASIGVGVLLFNTVKGVENTGGIYSNVLKQLLAAGFGLVAIAMLSWMLVWMSLQAKSLKGEVESAISEALNQNNAGKGIFLLVFIAVLREGFETVLFILAKFSQQLLLPSMGAVLGLIVAGIMGYLLFALGIKINISLFFKVMGIFLLLIVGGLVLSALYHLDKGVLLFSQISHSNWCINGNETCFLGIQVWDGSRVLPDRQFPGIILKALFGYRQTLYLGQIIAYLTFLTTVGTMYFQSLNVRQVKTSTN